MLVLGAIKWVWKGLFEGVMFDLRTLKKAMGMSVCGTFQRSLS